ncbi:MAG: tetratricopeptide repeat protein [Sneathiellaceae bacterium]
MRSLCLAAAALALLLWAMPAAAQLGDKPTADYRAAFEAALPRAQAGDPRAQVQVGRYYLSGQGVAADPREAARWFRAAAETGRVEAMKWLADLYFSGTGVAQDDAAGLDWLTRAAIAGDTDARSILGELYWRGERAPRDPVAAHAWLTLAAEKVPIPGSAQARRLLPEVEAGLTDAQRAAADALADRLRQGGAE